MTRLSFEPRPLDIHKKLRIVKSIKDCEDEIGCSYVSIKKLDSMIPTPPYVVVDSYVRDYARTFNQPTSYLHHGRRARADLEEFVEYDLDNEDEEWLQDLNKERKILPPEQLESLLSKLEVLEHKARERTGLITPTLGSSIPVLMNFDPATEVRDYRPT